MVQAQNRIWLEVRCMGRTSFFEMEEGQRPLGIGSGLCADVRVDGGGVALAHVELCRKGDAVWLVPLASGDVWLNAALVGTDARLPARAVIEFQMCVLEVTLHTSLPPHLLPSEAPGEEDEPPPVTLGAHWLGALRQRLLGGDSEEAR